MFAETAPEEVSWIPVFVRAKNIKYANRLGGVNEIAPREGACTRGLFSHREVVRFQKCLFRVRSPAEMSAKTGFGGGRRRDAVSRYFAPSAFKLQAPAPRKCYTYCVFLLSASIPEGNVMASKIHVQILIINFRFFTVIIFQR